MSHFSKHSETAADGENGSSNRAFQLLNGSALELVDNPVLELVTPVVSARGGALNGAQGFAESALPAEWRQAAGDELALQNAAVLGRIGTVVAERWLIERVIGAGSMGVVYAATHRNGQRVALKFLRSELRHVQEIRDRFLAEAYIANQVRHRAITKVFDDGITPDGSLYLVMELLDGYSLEEYRGAVDTVDLRTVGVILDGVLDVLDAAHRLGVVHRDIKPSNIFVCKDGSVRLLDFGVARARNTKNYETVSGAVIGTLSFMSPEQARGQSDRVDARSDLFSLAATAYVLLTGQNIRQAQQYGDELLAAATTPVRPIVELRPDLPRAWCALINRALSFDREKRFESAAVMQAALQACFSASVTDSRLARRSLPQTVTTSSLPQTGGADTTPPVSWRQGPVPNRARVSGVWGGAAIAGFGMALLATWIRLHSVEPHGSVTVVEPGSSVPVEGLPTPSAATSSPPIPTIRTEIEDVSRQANAVVPTSLGALTGALPLPAPVVAAPDGRLSGPTPVTSALPASPVEFSARAMSQAASPWERDPTLAHEAQRRLPDVGLPPNAEGSVGRPQRPGVNPSHPRRVQRRSSDPLAHRD